MFGLRAFAQSYAIVTHVNATHIKCEAAGGSLDPARLPNVIPYRIEVWETSHMVRRHIRAKP